MTVALEPWNVMGEEGAIGGFAAQVYQTLSDNGARLQALITNRVGLTNTAEAQLTVLRDTNRPSVIAVPVQSPWKTIRDLVEDSKRRPGAIVFGSAGTASFQHFAIEWSSYIKAQLLSKTAWLIYLHIQKQL